MVGGAKTKKKYIEKVGERASLSLFDFHTSRVSFSAFKITQDAFNFTESGLDLRWLARLRR